MFTGRNEVVAKVMFLQVSVIHSVHRGVCLSACWDTTPRTRQTPPRTRQTSPDQADPPRPGRPPSPDQADHPPGPGRPPRTRQTPQTRQTPPPEADSSIRSTSGRYASYWNAFLFIVHSQFFLNYQQHNWVGTSVHNFFLFVSLVEFIIVTHKKNATYTSN